MQGKEPMRFIAREVVTRALGRVMPAGESAEVEDATGMLIGTFGVVRFIASRENLMVDIRVMVPRGSGNAELILAAAKTELAMIMPGAVID